MKKYLITMLICICLVCSSCKYNPNALPEEKNATLQNQAGDTAEQNDSLQSQQKNEDIQKEEVLLPDDIQTENSDSSNKEKKEIPPLVPIENGVYRRTGDFDGLPVGFLSFSSYIYCNNIDDFSKDFNIQDYIIIKAIKKSNSTSVLTVKNSMLIDWYSETPVEVLDAYYGDVRANKQIIIDEEAVLLGEGEYASVGCDDNTKIIKKNVEYILFLRKSDRKTEDGKTMYNCFYAAQSVYEINEELIAQVFSNTEYKTLAKDVYTIYYQNVDNLDRRIDVEKETQKLIERSESNSLTEDQIQLLERLSKQYGTK